LMIDKKPFCDCLTIPLGTQGVPGFGEWIRILPKKAAARWMAYWRKHDPR